MSTNYKQQLNKLKLFLKENFEPGSIIKFKLKYQNTNNAPFIFDNNLNYKILSEYFFLKEKMSTMPDTINSFLFELSKQGYLILEQNKEDEFHTTFIYTTTLKINLETSFEPTIFFAREFGNENTLNFFKKLNKKIQEELKMEVIMFETNAMLGNINNSIKNAIHTSSFFIADLTSKNEDIINNNVMYEIGMAHALDKPTLLIIDKNQSPFDNNKNNNKKLPFDISNHTTLSYSVDDNNDKKIKEILDYIRQELLKQ
ncbi:MAG: hypothetical protein ACRC9U_03450 [Metamycoplasmataceae bacterium]